MSRSKTEELLAVQLASGPVHDRVLQKILRISDFEAFSIGIGLNFVVGGSIISGTLLSPIRFGKRIDASLSSGMTEAIERYEEGSTEHAAATIWGDKVKSLFADSMAITYKEEEEHRKALANLAEEKGIDDPNDLSFGDLPDEIAFEEIASDGFRSAFSLEKAVLSAPPTFAQHEIGTIRIQTAQIEAWWLSGVSDSDPPEPTPAASDSD
jgi:hypothetical protein